MPALAGNLFNLIFYIMQVLCILEEVTAVRTFKTQRGEDMDVADVILKSGCDSIVASAIGDKAAPFKDGKIKKGVLYSADLFLSVQKTDKGTFQRCQIDRIEAIFDVSAF